jgi:multisubunit Na+/H+ antiporter MnhE subunit
MSLFLLCIFLLRNYSQKSERLIFEIYFSLSVLTVLFHFFLKCLNCPCVSFLFVLIYLCLYAHGEL